MMCSPRLSAPAADTQQGSVDPITGHLACGYEAKGKLASNEDIVEYVKVLMKEDKR